MTREAYFSIGGVGGALAQHAEETLARIGLEHEPVVREIFRNLVSGQGTRVPMGTQELLSVFPDRNTASEVLGKLVDGRLLTSSEVAVEIIHESLLAAWPRLVRWQTQDADAAVFRDQLRQASRAWEERRRADDLLWTGISFRELAVFRERYTGGLTAVEKEFADASTRLFERTRRRRRIAVSVLVASLAIVAVVTSSLWRRSRAEALRAEAAKLLALGQLEIDEYPTAALAYAIRSLELSDTEEARRFALRALQVGPPATPAAVYTEEGREANTVSFSPDGEWLAVGGYRKVQLLHRDGGEPLVLSGEYPDAGFRSVDVGFGPSGDILVTDLGGDVRLWAIPEGKEIQKEPIFERGNSVLFMRGRGFFTSTVGDRQFLRFWPLGGGESRLIGSTNASRKRDINPAGTLLAYAIGRRLHLRSIERWDAPEVTADLPAEIADVGFSPDGGDLAVSDTSGQVRIWETAGSFDEPSRILSGADAGCSLRYSPRGRWLGAMCDGEDGRSYAELWDLRAPPGAKPLRLASDRIYLNGLSFDPSERWLVTAEAVSLAFWPLDGSYPFVYDRRGGLGTALAFTPDQTALLSATGEGLLTWPLRGDGNAEPRVLLKARLGWRQSLAVAPEAGLAAVAGTGTVYVIPIAGGPVRELKGLPGKSGALTLAVSPDGRFLAAAPQGGDQESKVVRIWDIATQTEREFGPVPGAGEGTHGRVDALVFLDEDRLLGTSYLDGLFLLDLRSGELKLLHEAPNNTLAVSRTGRFGYGTFGGITPEGWLLRFELNGKTPEKIDAYGTAYGISLDPTETILATGGLDGIVRIGPVSGGKPYLFFGHKRLVDNVVFSPDGRWLASTGADMSIRLWPVPDVTKTPPHERSHEELLAMLRSWTNLRVVPDEASSTGWKLEVGPFPGWEKLPEN